jgi:hypothetical protein
VRDVSEEGKEVQGPSQASGFVFEAGRPVFTAEVMELERNKLTVSLRATMPLAVKIDNYEYTDDARSTEVVSYRKSYDGQETVELSGTKFNGSFEDAVKAAVSKMMADMNDYVNKLKETAQLLAVVKKYVDKIE